MPISVAVRSRLTIADGAPQDVGLLTYKSDETYIADFAPGTGDGQVDTYFTDTRSVAASSNESLDIRGGITNVRGQTVALAHVNVFRVEADPDNVNDVVIGGAGGNPWKGPFADVSDKIAIPPGGCFEMTHPGAGWPVVAATGDILLVTNSGAGTPVVYTIALVGRSA